MWRLKWLGLTILAAVLIVSALTTALLPRTYQGTATLRVLPPRTLPEGTDTFAQLQTSQALARTYAELLKYPQIYRETIAKEHLSLGSEALIESTTVTYVEGTELVNVQVEAQDPRLASSRANAVARTFVDEQKEASDERLTLAQPSIMPDEPVSPSWPLNMSLGLVLGTVSALGAVMLWDFLSDRVSSQQELEKLVEAPVIGSLPEVELGERILLNDELSMQKTKLRGAYEEAIQTLRVNLAFILGTS